MSGCMNLLLLLLLSLTALLRSSSAAADEKLTTCCTSVSSSRIQEPITGAVLQKPSKNCVQAIIFKTEKNQYCIYPRASWVGAALLELKEKLAKTETMAPSSAPSTKVSLLSIITSTTRPSSSSPSSSSSYPSSSPTSFSSSSSSFPSSSSPTSSSSSPVSTSEVLSSTEEESSTAGF